MNRGAGIALLAVGLVLVILGIHETDSFASQVSKFFTGNPTDRAIWLMIGGVAALVGGAWLTLAMGRPRD